MHVRSLLACGSAVLLSAGLMLGGVSAAGAGMLAAAGVTEAAGWLGGAAGVGVGRWP